jgi:hypothetical protein
MPMEHANTARRNALALAGLPAMMALCGAGAAHAKSPSPSTQMLEQTYLKAKPERKEALARYIELNWFVMDKLGMQAGIFTSFDLLAAIDDNKDWDLVMVVGYPQDQGFSDPKARDTFMAIRQAHVEVKVDGLGLKELGDIVQHHRLKLQARGLP